ncbi:facilitated trehalose transporter Tret1-like [Anoplophora glabripennis]|uniref:facilitated trehalose transporter Tret1-like n=1 Tax=Anoplophora glabripennis TaxID=217634 RepID=UPI0008741812|nr:facilitated trehalose transporter Tret1-like [Anoplophora glabripennis]
MINLQPSYTLLTVFAVDLLATSGDITLSWTSPIYPKLYSNDTSINPLGKPITEDEDAMIGSVLTLGAMIGPLPFGFIAEKFGRKPALLSIAVPHIISYLTMAFSKNVYLYYLGRALGGLAMGGGYSVLPMYLAEISKDSNRGAMTQTLNVFWATGNFLPYAIGPYISILYFNIILACIPITFFLVFFFVGVETPYYLVRVNKITEAEEALMLLRSSDQKEVQNELEHIQTCINEEEKGNFIDIFRKTELRKALIICIVLIIAQEISGFCAITFYLQPIFDAAGTGLPSDISAIVIGFSMLVSSFFAPFLIERAGRKKLTIYSCFGMFLSLTILGAFFYIQDSSNLSTDSIFWLPIFSLMLYIFSFNFGIGSVPWTLCSELFPSSFKQFSSTTVSIVCWITSFMVTKFFNSMNYGMGIAGTFWFFGGTCLLATIFSILWVPETKGKSFIEIQNMLRGKGSEVSALDLQDT